MVPRIVRSILIAGALLASGCSEPGGMDASIDAGPFVLDVPGFDTNHACLHPGALCVTPSECCSGSCHTFGGGVRGCN